MIPFIFEEHAISDNAVLTIIDYLEEADDFYRFELSRFL